METAASYNTISFGWQGPHEKTTELELQQVRVIELQFKNKPTQICIHLPENLATDTIQQLPFSCTRPSEKQFLDAQKIKHLKEETFQENTLTVITDEMRDLTIRVVSFVTNSQGGPFKKVSVLDLETPPKIEEGLKYQILITSTPQLGLRASLVKANDPTYVTPEYQQLIKDREEVTQFLLDVLDLLIKQIGNKFAEQLSDKDLTDQIDKLSLMKNRNPQIAVIKFVVNNIDTRDVQEMTIKIRAFRNEKNSGDLALKKKEAISTCLTIIGSKGLIKIIRATMECYVVKNYSADMGKLLTEVSEEFNANCLKLMS